MGYKKPLLIELLSELDLEVALSGDAVFDFVADLRKSGYPRVELASGMVPAPGPIQAFQPRLRSWSTDGTKLVQVSATQIVVNQIGEYLGWSEFRDMFVGVLETAKRHGPIAPNALSLQAIDQLAVASAGFRLGKYFACDGKRIPQWYDDCAEACDITLGRGHAHEGGKNRQLGLQMRNVGHEFAISLTTTFKDRLRSADALPTLEKLHEEATSVFEAVITDETRNLMGIK